MKIGRTSSEYRPIDCVKESLGSAGQSFNVGAKAKTHYSENPDLSSL